jgi:hypothetical protein
MKYDFAVKKQYEKFINNTVCGKQLNEYQLDCVKRYMQYCYEAGHAQGYADRIYDSENPESEYCENGIDIRTGEPFYK